MTWWEITLWSIPASLPAALVWRWRVRRAHARMAAEVAAYHRARFGGAIKLPGQKKARRIERRDH
jgi:uncharacterized membrane protein YqiK